MNTYQANSKKRKVVNKMTKKQKAVLTVSIATILAIGAFIVFGASIGKSSPHVNATTMSNSATSVKSVISSSINATNEPIGSEIDNDRGTNDDGQNESIDASDNDKEVNDDGQNDAVNDGDKETNDDASVTNTKMTTQTTGATDNDVETNDDEVGQRNIVPTLKLGAQH